MYFFCNYSDRVAGDDTALLEGHDDVGTSRHYGGWICHHRRQRLWGLRQIWGKLNGSLSDVPVKNLFFYFIISKMTHGHKLEVNLVLLAY